MKQLKYFVIGSVLAVALIQIYCMVSDIGAGIKLYKSLTPQQIAEVRAIVNALGGE